jgi:hypothetical protein
MGMKTWEDVMLLNAFPYEEMARSAMDSGKGLPAAWMQVAGAVRGGTREAFGSQETGTLFRSHARHPYAGRSIPFSLVQIDQQLSTGSSMKNWCAMREHDSCEKPEVYKLKE